MAPHPGFEPGLQGFGGLHAYRYISVIKMAELARIELAFALRQRAVIAIRP